MDNINLGEAAGPGGEDFDTVRYDMSAFVQDLEHPEYNYGTNAISARMLDGTLRVTDPWGNLDQIEGAEQLIGTNALFNPEFETEINGRRISDFVRQDGSVDFFRFRGLDGNDNYTGHQRTYDSLDYRWDDGQGGSQGIVADARAFGGNGGFSIRDGFGDVDFGSSIDEVRGTRHDDLFLDDDGDIRLRGEGGDDLFHVGQSGRKRLDGGDGFDTVVFDDISGNSGGVVVRLAQSLVKSREDNALRVTIDGLEEIIGSSLYDRFSGTTGDDVFDGAAGDDVIRGRGGEDWLIGGAGDDDIETKGVGADLLEGGAGNDRIRAAGGDDLVEGGAGDDILRGGTDNDTLLGGDDNDRLFGQGGDDRLEGGSGDDYIEGGNGRDTLLGGLGEDVLRGGASVDILDGGAGMDRLYGGDGRDVFVFSLSDEGFGPGVDRIKDWEDGLDRLDLTALNIDYSSARASATETSGGHLSIDLDVLGRILIENMTLDQLTQDDFV